MSKVNPTVTPAPAERLAGGSGAVAAKQSAENQLRRAVLACLLWENLAYESGSSDNIATLIPKVKAFNVATIVEEARVVQKLRHVPLFMISEMCKYPEHKAYVKDLLPKVITRVDQMMDLIAIYWKSGKKPLPAQMKKGLAKCFYNFDEYQFAKYDRDNQIKLRDVFFLVHPKARNQEEYSLFDRIAKRELKVPDTWEVALSTGKDKKATWERLMLDNKLGALAMLRNLRNMKDVKVDSNIIKKSLLEIKGKSVLPLNYLAAVQYAPEYKSEIQAGMIKSYSYLPKLPGKTLFIVDVSGSMGSPVSSKSTFTRLDAAKAMALLGVNQCEWIDLWCTAGNDGSIKHATNRIDNPSSGFDLLQQIEDKRRVLGGGGIFTRQCLEYIKSKINYTPDRIIIFSDSQDCDKLNKIPSPFGIANYIVDVSSNKNGINYNDVWTAEISGWSEHFLTYVAAYEGVINVFEQED